jgi:hypothetical protein
VQSWSDGLASYEGEYRTGVRYGVGTVRYTDGRQFEGSWRNDVPEGRGTFLCVAVCARSLFWHLCRACIGTLLPLLRCCLGVPMCPFGGAASAFRRVPYHGSTVALCPQRCSLWSLTCW